MLENLQTIVDNFVARIQGNLPTHMESAAFATEVNTHIADLTDRIAKLENVVLAQNSDLTDRIAKLENVVLAQNSDMSALLAALDGAAKPTEPAGLPLSPTPASDTAATAPATATAQ
ncbi:hypothetical protein [Cupriavidus sp. CuC1]|uniref:hypothetical protein n=1 Tax=Cupriavidus sp. CuC1 TaxID=3373131 RepID=UPI0037D82469